MKKKNISDAKVLANRRNANNSTGPHNTSSTRSNATTHSLLSEGVTELDNAEGYRDALRRLKEAYFDEIDAFLVERIALYMVRLRRTPRLEAELITSILHPPVYGEGLKWPLDEPSLIDPGQPARIDSEGVEVLVRYQRYEAANENKLYRAMNQLERIRRMQQGEHLPAPIVGDVALHSENTGADSTGVIPFQSAPTVLESCAEVASANETNEQPLDLSESKATTEETN